MAHATDQARPILAWQNGAASSGDDEAFGVRELLPKSRWPKTDRYTMILEPLTHERKQFGMLLSEMGPREGIIYESLREQIGGALNSASLVEQVVEEITQRQWVESERRKSVQDPFDNMQQAICCSSPDSPQRPRSGMSQVAVSASMPSGRWHAIWAAKRVCARQRDGVPH